MAAELIILDGQVLSATDRFGNWKVTNMEGWTESPDPKEDDVELPQADGDYDLPTYYKARYITVTGRLMAQNHDYLHAAMNRFSSLLQGTGTFQVSGHGPTQWAMVKRASGMSIAAVTDTFAHWQVRLKAPNPRKFGDVNTYNFATALRLTHRGNYFAVPKLMISGDGPEGYTITSADGNQYGVTRPVQVGRPHYIDLATGILTQDGVTIIGQKSAADILRVLPGSGSTFTLTYPSGSPTVTATVLDTYI